MSKGGSNRFSSEFGPEWFEVQARLEEKKAKEEKLKLLQAKAKKEIKWVAKHVDIELSIRRRK